MAHQYLQDREDLGVLEDQGHPIKTKVGLQGLPKAKSRCIKGRVGRIKKRLCHSQQVPSLQSVHEVQEVQQVQEYRSCRLYHEHQ